MAATLPEELDESGEVASESAALLRDDYVRAVGYGIADRDDGNAEPPKRKDRRRMASIVVMLFSMFVSSISFTIVFASVSPYFHQIDRYATISFLGYIIAACSFGQLIASPVLGVWSSHRPVIEPLIASLIVSICGNLFYSYGFTFGENGGKWVLFSSRFIIGIGTGNVAIARSYLSAASTESERNLVMSLLSTMQGLGFIVGPALGLVFKPLGSVGVEWHALKMYFNLYTGPGYLVALLSLVNITMVILLFKEFDVHGTKVKVPLSRLVQRCFKIGKSDAKDTPVTEKRLRRLDAASISVSVKEDDVPKYDFVAAIVSIVLFFLILSVFTVLETLLAPVAQDEFAWSNQQTAFNVNLISAVNSVVSITAFLGTGIIIRKVSERMVFVAGMLLMIIGFVVWLPYGPGYPQITDLGITINGSISSNGTSLGVGCNVAKEPWCSHIHKIHLFQYFIGLPIFTLGYCSSSLLCYTIYSKILGPKPQGLMMGLISASGSGGRTLGPLLLAMLYDKKGPLVTFLLCIGLVALGVAILLVFYRRLVPFSVYVKKVKIKQETYVKLND